MYGKVKKSLMKWENIGGTFEEKITSMRKKKTSTHHP
jgi:hypothetical protein